MNAYDDLRIKHQKEINMLPFFFAFSEKQFAVGMATFGLTPADTDKIYKLGDIGGFYLRTDAKLIRDTFKRHESERQAALDADATGDGFIYEMFLHELRNHEFGYTWELDSALDAVGLTMDEINASKTLTHGLNKAIDTIRKYEKSRKD
jgi:hypothetical protein